MDSKVGFELLLLPSQKKTVALEALNEIRSAFEKSGLNEEELLKTQEKMRHGK